MNEIFDHKEICNRLKAIRGERRLTQSQFAELLGTSREAYNKIEGGVNLPSAHILFAIRSRLNVSIDWILTGSSQLYDFGPLSASVNEMLNTMFNDKVLLHLLLANYYFLMKKPQKEEYTKTNLPPIADYIKEVQHG